jgi:hypothetical protein
VPPLAMADNRSNWLLGADNRWQTHASKTLPAQRTGAATQMAWRG